MGAFNGLYSFLSQIIDYGNTEEQFASSPDLSQAILDAIMDALQAHTAMSSQALNSQRIRDGLKDTLLGPAQLYEALRAREQPPTAPM